MATQHELSDTLIALTPRDGSRISNAEIKAALEQESGVSTSEAELKQLKTRVISMEAAEAAMGPGGGRKASGIDRPPRTRTTPKKKNAPVPPQSAIAPGTIPDSILTGALDDKSAWIRVIFRKMGIDKPVRKAVQIDKLWPVMEEGWKTERYSGERT